MSEEINKTKVDHVQDTLTQLKEMRHYSKNNVEALSSAWMLFEGELSSLKRTEKIGDLMDRQGQLHDALESMIADLEEVLKKLQPEPEA
ncbi:MAG: hypothetical protein WC617_16640 [Rhodanobacter sp.]|jgi:hypothetical protein